MVDVTEIQKYTCENCGSEYEDEGDADNCCPNFVSEATYYVCGACEQEYVNESEAKKCCANKD